MIKLQEHDILFLLKKTKLSLKNLINLIEEDRDFNLVIDSISNNLTEEDKKDLYLLSDKLRTKLILYHSSQSKNYDISEKSYISDIISINYDYIYKMCRLPKKGEKNGIKQFISVINSNNLDNNKLNIIINYFVKLGYKNISNHIYDWINIIKNTKEIISKNKK